MGFLDWLGRKWAKKLDFTKVDSVLKAEALAAEGKLAPLHLVPLRFGGQDMPMNRVFVPVSVVNRKDHYDETIEVKELMQEAEGELFRISQQNIRNEAVQINPIIKEARELLERAANRKEGLSGLPTGFADLDKITSGWQNSDLVIVAARPAMGKTAFVLSMARNMAVTFKVPVAMFSLEMSNVQLVNRLIVNVCELPGEKIKSGRLEKYEWEQLEYKIKDLYDAPIYVDDTPSLSIFELRTKARRLVREHKIQCIFIDYLQLMNASGMNFGSREQEVSTISRSLKGLAKELNIPIIALSQLNRGVEARQGIEGKRPQLADLRESGAIEQDADMVCFIHRPEYYKILEDERGNSLAGIAEIIVAKHRNGATGDVRLRFKSEFAKFINLSEDQAVREYASSMNQEEGPRALNEHDGSIYASNINQASALSPIPVTAPNVEDFIAAQNDEPVPY